MTIDKIDAREFNPNIEPVEDKIHRTIRATAASIPIVGGALAEVVNAIVAPPFEVRTNAWLNQLSDTLNVLIEKHNHTKAQLSRNETLISAILRSSDIAVRTSSLEITKALSNGLINIVINQNQEEAVIAIYLNSISRLTSLHLKLLSYLSQLPELDLNMQLTEELQLKFFNDLSAYDNSFSVRHIVQRLMQDLMNEKIIGLPDKASQSFRGPNFINMRLTKLGEELLEYISENKR